jgi:prepilin-type N-terminal cleavage/methylation domain-containing protein
MKKIINKGFTLIELAVALTIVALVIGGLAVPMSKRIAEQQYIDTQATLDKAMDALVGFAIQNRRLPCPDITTAANARDGIEDVTLSGTSVSSCGAGTGLIYANATDANGVSWGDLPWQTLGIAPPNNADAWNNRLRYAVFTPLVTQALPATPAFCNNTGTTAGIGFANLSCLTNPAAAGPGITAAVLNAQLDIRCTDPVTKTAAPTTAPLGCNSTAVTTPPTYGISQNAVVVIYSMGANGLGATNISNIGNSTPFTIGPGSTSVKFPDEAVNAPELDSTAANRRMFATRARTDATSGSGQFDDVLTFMSSNTLAAKLSTAGVWP